jgi:hypothetical protein
LQLRLTITGRHASGIQGQDRVVEAFQAGLSFFHHLGLNGPLPVTRHAHVDLTVLSFQGVLALPSARVARLVALAGLCGRAQMRVPFRFQASLDHGFREVCEETVFGQHILWIGRLCEQFVSSFASDGQSLLLPFGCHFLRSDHVHTLFYTLCAHLKVQLIDLKAA